MNFNSISRSSSNPLSPDGIKAIAQESFDWAIITPTSLVDVRTYQSVDRDLTEPNQSVYFTLYAGMNMVHVDNQASVDAHDAYYSDDEIYYREAIIYDLVYKMDFIFAINDHGEYIAKRIKCAEATCLSPTLAQLAANSPHPHVNGFSTNARPFTGCCLGGGVAQDIYSDLVTEDVNEHKLASFFDIMAVMFSSTQDEEGGPYTSLEHVEDCEYRLDKILSMNPAACPAHITFSYINETCHYTVLRTRPESSYLKNNLDLFIDLDDVHKDMLLKCGLIFEKDGYYFNSELTSKSLSELVQHPDYLSYYDKYQGTGSMTTAYLVPTNQTLEPTVLSEFIVTPFESIEHRDIEESLDEYSIEFLRDCFHKYKILENAIAIQTDDTVMRFNVLNVPEKFAALKSVDDLTGSSVHLKKYTLIYNCIYEKIINQGREKAFKEKNKDSFDEIDSLIQNYFIGRSTKHRSIPMHEIS